MSLCEASRTKPQNREIDMSRRIRTVFRTLPQWGLVFLLGYAAGGWTQAPVSAETEPAGTRRQAFLAGGERSELVLREMQKTLEKMDARLANIERSAAAIEKQTRP